MRTRDKVIFLICHFVPYPPASGIQTRVYRLLKWMKDAGYPVVLVIAADFTDANALKELRRLTFATYWTRPAQATRPALRTRLGLRFPFLRRMLWRTIKSAANLLRGKRISDVDAPPIPAVRSQKVNEWFVSDKLLRRIGKIARKYDVRAVIAEYIFAAPLFSAFPDEALKIVDTIDVFSLKESQVGAFGIDDFLACGEEEERRYLLRADLVVAIQAREATLLQALVPEREVILAGVDFDVIAESHAADAIPFRIAVVASDNPLNVHGLSTFLAECWPHIKQCSPGASLHVVGRVGNFCRIDDSSIQISGWVADLDAVYRDASVVINPTIAGTGLKIKSVEALAHGKPLVAWSHGVDGLTYEGQAPFIECHSWSEFAAAVVLLLSSDDERFALATRALSYARATFGASSVYAELHRHLGEPSPS